MCDNGDVELLYLLLLLRAEAGELGKAGGDRDTSSGVARYLRG